jgi:pentatricopeptide repeat protein
MAGGDVSHNDSILFLQVSHSMTQPEPFSFHAASSSDADSGEVGAPALIVSLQGDELAPEQYMRLGNTAYDRYIMRESKPDLEAAIAHYRKALMLKPDCAEGYVRLAAALWDKGELTPETAIRYCRRAIELDSGLAEAHLYLGYFLRNDDRFLEALAEFNRAIKISPWRMPKARVARGMTRMRLSLDEDAGGPWTQAREMLLGMGDILSGFCFLPLDRKTFKALQLAFSHDMIGLTLPEVGKWMAACGGSQWVPTLYRWASRTLDHPALAQEWLGDFLALQHRADDAIAAYRQALTLEPDNLTLLRKMARLHLAMADTLNATRLLERIAGLTEDAPEFEVVYQLAQLYTERRDHIRALYYYKESLKLLPTNPYAHSNLAYVLFKLEDYEGAVLEYQAAINYGEDPVWTATVAKTLATIYHKIRQDNNAAISMFQLAVQLDPNNLECQTMLVDLYCEEGQLEAAVAVYQKIVRREPDNADAHNFLGYLLWQLGRSEEAAHCYENALACDSRNVIACNNLGVIYLDDRREYQPALQLFERALSLKPDYTMACFNAARALEGLGRSNEAAEAYSRSMALNAESPELDVDEIVARLERLFESR